LGGSYCPHVDLYVSLFTLVGRSREISSIHSLKALWIAAALRLSPFAASASV
jgi:hypothetical protein